MLAKYDVKIEQTEEEALEKTSDFLTTIGALKKYVFRLKSADPAGGMVWTNIKLRHDVPILDLLEYAKDGFRAE